MKRKQIQFLLITVIVMIIISYPYLFRSFLPIEQDTFFHLSRIEGYAKSISQGNWIPNIYFDKNHGYGYASALFYSDVFLLPSALLYLAGLPISLSFKVTIIITNLCTWFSVFHCTKYIIKSNAIAILTAFAFLTSNYRINDIYVRGSLGELFAMIFLPLLILGIYQMMIEHHEKKGSFYLITALTGLILSHNLSFLLGILLFVIIYVILGFYSKNFHFKAIFYSFMISFLLTSFFTLPMIEQLHSQTLFLDYYKNHNMLYEYALRPIQLIQNHLSFGPGGYGLYKGDTMPLNPGYFLLFLPLLTLFHKQAIFFRTCLFLAYLSFLMTSQIFPWSHFWFLSILQFPWRIILISSTLLIIPFAKSLEQFKSKKIIYILFACITVDAGIKISPVLHREFGINDTDSYEKLLDNSLIDQDYSAFYSRVELAGGEYLPVGSIHFKEYPYSIKNELGETIQTTFHREKNTFSFTLSQKTHVELPITWYFGYIIKNEDNQIFKTYPSTNGLVSAELNQGIYQCFYKPTFLQQVTKLISLSTMIVLLLIYSLQHKFDSH